MTEPLVLKDGAIQPASAELQEKARLQGWRQAALEKEAHDITRRQLGAPIREELDKVKAALGDSKGEVARVSQELNEVREELGKVQADFAASRHAELVGNARASSLLHEREALAAVRRGYESNLLLARPDHPVDQVWAASRALAGSRIWALTVRIQRAGHPGRRDGLRDVATEVEDLASALVETVRGGASAQAIAALAAGLMIRVDLLRGLRAYRLARVAHGLAHKLRFSGNIPTVLDTMQVRLHEIQREADIFARVDHEIRPESERKEAVAHRLVLPQFDQCEVSIIIPVHNQALFTFTCLKAVLLNTSSIAYEVIVVDDKSSDNTEDMLTCVEGVRVERNPVNLGFLESCRRGAEFAKGRYLLFLNNDTAPLPGWLEALIAIFQEDPLAGLVGPKLLNDDGTLQEAGGIVWRDGRAWNYGRGHDPQRPEYNYRRKVDYLSGACLAIPRDLYFAVGGFDERYAPAYYEDTDLAMTVTAAGRHVIYQPRAEVVHFDGMTQRETGTKQYMARNAVLFREKWAAAVDGRREEGQDPDLEKDRDSRGRILVVDHYVPTPDQDSGSVRMFGILSALTSLGYKVTFAPDNLNRSEPYTRNLQALGVEVLYGPYVSDLGAYIRDTAGLFDWAVLSRFHIAPSYIDILRQTSPATRIAYDTVDLGFVRTRRLAELTGTAAHKDEAEDLRERELTLARKADVTLVVSDIEADALKNEDPSLVVAVVSNIHRARQGRPPFEGRSGLLFIGGFDHPPNADGVVHFVQSILPLVLEHIPDLVLYVLGSRPPAEVVILASKHVVVTGFVPDVLPYFDTCRLSVAPLRYGAGVKGKVNQSMALGLPVVATPIAVEGIPVQDGTDVMVAEDPTAFAEAILSVYTDADLWEKLSKNGISNIARYFSEENATAVLARILDPAQVAMSG